MESRYPVDEIIAYNKQLLDDAHLVPREEQHVKDRDLTHEALSRKLDALASSPFRFFRGTFHLMAFDLLHGRLPGAKARAPDGLIVGDLHLENFGTYRGASGALVFDVNDFDDVGFGPLDLDLKRLCTSAFLIPGLAHGPRLAAAKTIAKSWADAIVRIGGRFPVPSFDEAKAEGLVKTLLSESGRKTRAVMVQKICAGKSQRAFEESDKFGAIGKPLQKIATDAIALYQDSLKQLHAPDPPTKGWEVLDVAYRFKGTGSLGRLRFSVLLGHGDDRRVFELKEVRQSVIDQARGKAPGRDRARTVTAAIRRLQGDPWPRVAATLLGKVPAIGRENEPEEEKISSERFAPGQGDAHHEQLDLYARQCGEVLARLHCRENAPVMLDEAWDPAGAAHAAVEFAEKYAAQVEADQKAFVHSRGKVAAALGLAT